MDINFNQVKQYDKSAVALLSDYFDMNIVSDDVQIRTKWFRNLSELAQQNLGLAVCVIHNHTSRGAIDIANQYLGSKSINLPYKDYVGSFSFAKHVWNKDEKFVRDTIRLTGNRLSGKKYLASGLKNADYFVLRVYDATGKKRWVYLDLSRVPHQLEPNYGKIIGLEIAEPYNLSIDAELPSNWILDAVAPTEELTLALEYYNYGQITNYWSASKALLEVIKKQAARKHYNLELEIGKLEKQVSSCELLWQEKLLSIGLAPRNQDLVRNRSMQLAHSKKAMLDTINLFNQIATSSQMQLDTHSQMYRDCLLYLTHPNSFYSLLQYPDGLQEQFI